MRYLIYLTIVLFLTPIKASEGTIGLEHMPGAELVSEEADSLPGVRLVVLGALEKVNHELEPEASDTVLARRVTRTWYLPQARRTSKVLEHYQPQLEALGEILFQCRGRGCGSSSFWANRIFNQAILYGPEQYQRYLVIRLASTGEYLAVYIGERATRKIYLHMVHFSDASGAN